MSLPTIDPLKASFARVEDPRAANAIHPLSDIIIIAICAVICGADSWVEVEAFGRAKEKWLKKFLELPAGIPSHDTFGRVFRLIDAEQFQESFAYWVKKVYELTAGQVVPIDGKQLRRSHDKALGMEAIYMVSAWASHNRLVLGQVKVDEKSNEITAIPDLLDLLELTGCIVTTDAMGCQKEIAAKIKKKGADYVLALKENHPGTYADVVSLFEFAQETEFADCDYYRSLDKDHGRLEIRQCWTICADDYLPFVRNHTKWSGLQTLVMVQSERHLEGQVSTQTRYFLSSLSASAKEHLQVVRSHWHIENRLHWVLDIAFREDDCRVRKGNGPQNFSLLRHLALNLLKQESSATCGLKAKRLKAGWDEDYLLKVLSF